jgi:transcriptional regulator with XRE-family HTH domain
MSPVNVGERIRQLRLGLGLSVRALAAETGFSPSLISQVEHSHVMPSIGSLERIAMALGVSLSTISPSPKRTLRGWCAPTPVKSSPARGHQSRSRPCAP